MPDSDPLPHLIRLLDDPSPVVQDAVTQQLAIYGNALDSTLRAYGVRLTHDQRERLDNIRSGRYRDTLRANWLMWRDMTDYWEQLEATHVLLSDFHTGYREPGALEGQLDELALAYREQTDEISGPTLAAFLFGREGIKGNHEKYYSPDRSILSEVIRQRSGNPISLASLLMLVGRRVDLEIHGCNFPGHFLGRTVHNGKLYLVDCFNGGRFITANAFRDLNNDNTGDVQSVIAEPAPVEALVTRILNNLANAYHLAGRDEDGALMLELQSIQQRESVDASGL